MKYSIKQYALALDAVTRTASPHEIDALVNRFIVTLGRERAIALLPQILAHYEALQAERDGQTILYVERSEPLSSETKKILAAACSILPSKVVWREASNPALIAGARVRFRDHIFTVSLADRLERLSRALV